MKQRFPPPALRPADKPIIYLGGQIILRWHITLTATGLQNVYNTADHTAIIDALLAPNICRQ